MSVPYRLRLGLVARLAAVVTAAAAFGVGAPDLAVAAGDAGRCPASLKGTVAHSARGRVVIRSVHTRWGVQPTVYGCLLGQRLRRIDNAGRDLRGRALFPQAKPTYAFAPGPRGLATARGDYYAYVQRRDYDIAVGGSADSVAAWALVIVDLRSGHRTFSSGLASGNGQIHAIVATAQGAGAWIRTFGLGQTGVFIADAGGVRSPQTSGPDAGPPINLYSLTLAPGGRGVAWTTADGMAHTAVLSGAARQP